MEGDPYVIGCIDTAWMSEKKLKWIGTDRSGEAAWIDPQGMMYNLKDLKRNERGIKYENEEKKLELIDHSTIRQYSDKKMDHYEWELKIQKNCGFCHDHRDDPKPDKEDKEHGGGTKENLDDDSWQNIAKGDTSEYDKVTETDDFTFTDHVTDDNKVTDTGDNNDQKNDGDEGANGQTKEPKDEKEEKEDIPPVPLRPPVKLPTEDENQQPWLRPKVVPPVEENPVLQSKKLVTNNSKVTRNLFKQEEDNNYNALLKKGSPTKQQKTFAEEQIDKEREKIKQEAGDGDVLIRVVYEGPRKPDGDHDDVIYEEEIQKGNPRKPKEIYQIYVKGLTDNDGLTAAGSITKRWITENQTPLEPVLPSPVNPWPTPKAPWEPAIVYKIPNIQEIPKIPRKTGRTVYIPPTKPDATPVPEMCLACLLRDSDVHVIRDRSALILWLRTNPDYFLEIQADGASNDTVWTTKLWNKVKQGFNTLVEAIRRTNGDLANNLILKPGNPGGVKVQLKSIPK